MYEHPYLAYRTSEFDQEQMERALERRRIIAERSDQIVPRPAGPVRRMLERMLHRGVARASAVPAERAVPVERALPCEPLAVR